MSGRNRARLASQDWKIRMMWLGSACCVEMKRVVGMEREETLMHKSKANGHSRMYGQTDHPDFSHVEGYEDHSVNLLYTWDAGR